MASPMIGSRTVRMLPEFIQEREGDTAVAKVFLEDGPPLDHINRRGTYILEQDLLLLLEKTSRHLGISNVGLVYGGDLRMERWGTYGEFVTGGYTLQDGLTRVIAAQKYHSSHDEFSFEVSGDEFRFIHRSPLRDLIGYKHFAPGAVLAILNVFWHYLGFDWRPSRIELDIPSPKCASDFEQILGCTVVFGRSEIQVIANIEDLLSATLVKRKIRPVSLSDVRRSLRLQAPKNFPSVVAELLRAELGAIEDRPALESVASRLRIGPRTLQRRLVDEGLSFRDLLNGVRAERARELLLETEAPVIEIAMELGYSSSTHFTRAFRRSTGLTPSDLRRKT
jgi:AraC-like DNA-binding protein